MLVRSIFLLAVREDLPGALVDVGLPMPLELVGDIGFRSACGDGVPCSLSVEKNWSCSGGLRGAQ